MPVLECHTLGKRYGNAWALQDASLSLQAGSVHAILGENGAGKSTLMKIIAGLIQPDQGSIAIEDQPVSIRSSRQAQALGIAMVHQHFTLVPSMTVLENWALARGGAWLRRLHLRQELMGWAVRLGFALDPDRKIRDCSVGEQQRLEILKALACQPKILILDEPSAVLAPQEIDELLKLCTGLKNTGVAILLVTHKLAEVEAIADAVTILRRGRVVSHLSHEQLQQTSRDALGSLLLGDASISEQNKLVPSSMAAPQQKKPFLRFEQVQSADSRLQPLDLEVHFGELVGIGGVEGNGQEQLCRILAGLSTLRQGSVHFQESRLQGAAASRFLRGCVGHIPADRHQDGLALGLSVLENLALRVKPPSALLFGPFLRRARIREWATRLIRQFDIRTPGMDSLAWSLSGGNQQKIVLARELDAKPRLLLAAHPTRGLDIAAAEAVRSRLAQLVSEGSSVILISTDMDEILALSTRILILSRGRIFPVQARASLAEIGALMVQ